MDFLTKKCRGNVEHFLLAPDTTPEIIIGSLLDYK
jgi:hypothetical protein